MYKIEEYDVFDMLTGKISSSVNRALLRAFSLEGIDITTEQWSVLSCLWKKDKVTQQTLCNQTHKDKPSMTRLIDNLEKLKLVVRVSDANDRRKKIIHLTEKGANLKTKTIEVVRSTIQNALRGIDPADLSIGHAVLKKIMSNLNS